MSDRGIVKAALAGLRNVIGLAGTPQAITSQEAQRFRQRTFAADATAAATTTARVASFDRLVHIVSAKVFMEGYTVPQGASNFVSFGLFTDNDAAGGSYTVSATNLSTNVATLMQQQSQQIPLTVGATYNTLAAGNALYVSVTKGSSGQTLPAWGIDVVFEED